MSERYPSHLHGGSIGHGHLDEPDPTVDGHVELAEDPQDVVPPVENGHLLGKLPQRFRPRQVLTCKVSDKAFRSCFTVRF
jgi:hypothetical protein